MYITDLEARRLLSASVDSSGAITVTGTPQNDVITVTFANSKVTVDVNGQKSSFPIVASTTLSIDGLAGDDSIALDQSYPDQIGALIHGGSGNDHLVGGRWMDSIFGDDGNDTLEGGGGDDRLDGGFGDDVIGGGVNDGNDVAVVEEPRIHPYLGRSSGLPDSGEPGEHDTIGEDVMCGDGIGVINGTHNDDRIVISKFENSLIIKIDGKTDIYPSDSADGLQINGLAGNDTIQVDDSVEFGVAINGGSGNDLLIGGAGENTISGGNGNDTLNGGDNTDFLNGGLGSDVINGGNGNDFDTDYAEDAVNSFHGMRVNPVFASNSGLAESGEAGEHDLIGTDVEGFDGGAGNDTLIALGNEPVGVAGGAGDDLIVSESTVSAALYGGDGNDTIKGGPGNDTIDGNAGSDNLSGGAGRDQLSYVNEIGAVYIDLRGTSIGGAAGEDDIVASDFEDAAGADGNDTIIGNNADNVLFGGFQYRKDLIKGMGGNDTIYGSNGNDRLYGGAGVDHIYGGGGNDRIYSGDQSKDFVYGGSGHDSLSGDVLDHSVSVEGILN